MADPGKDVRGQLTANEPSKVAGVGSVPPPHPVVDQQQQRVRKDPATADGTADPRSHTNNNQHPTVLSCRLKIARLLRISQSRRSSSESDFDLLHFGGDRFISIFSLLVEVLLRGGFEKVTSNRLWSDVAHSLHCQHFSSNIGAQLKQRFEESGLLALSRTYKDVVDEVLNFASHEAGARQASLPSRAMTPIELCIFPEYTSPVNREKYLACRDHILQRWCLNCKMALNFDRDIRLGSNTFDPLLRHVFFALETLGYINWGCCNTLEETKQQRWLGSGNLSHSSRNIVVMGAGLSGLSCALQVARFGHRVCVLEGRNRVGGRVHTDRLTFSSPVDLGAMLITGVSGHPASVLMDQLKQKPYSVSDSCPIFSLGEVLDAKMDAKIESQFNAMLEHAAQSVKKSEVFPQQQQQEHTNKKVQQQTRGRRTSSKRSTSPTQPPVAAGEQLVPLSKYSGVVWSKELNRWRVFLTHRASGRREFLEGRNFDDEYEAAMVHDWAIDAQPLTKRTKYVDVRNVDRFPLDFVIPSDRKKSFEKRQRVLISELSSPVLDFTPNQLLGVSEANQAQEVISRLQKEHATTTTTTTNLLTTSSVDTNPDSLLGKMFSLTESDDVLGVAPEVKELESKFLAWHVANLEYACATSLSNVSASNWDQDDEHDWEGAHVMLPSGLGVLTEGMRRAFVAIPNTELRLGQTVTEIDFSTTACWVQCKDGTRVEGDAVVCTASLGVLKTPQSLVFTPPLPEWKTSAIHRLGFGNLNKVVMEFPHVFWDHQLDLFGRVVHTGSRGECYLFWALNRLNANSAILLALVAGDAAEEQEFSSDEDCMNRAYDAVKETFKHVEVPPLVACAVTRWRQDDFSKGTYSYIPPGSSGEDYLLMAEAVNHRLYFAGEATCREHPATTGGALVSGLREGAKLAARFGRNTTLRDEGDDAVLVNILDRIGRALSLFLPSDSSSSWTVEKKHQVETILHHVAHTAVLETPHQGPLMETENWVHRTAACENELAVQKNREWAFREVDIQSRLPSHWDEARRMNYLTERLGHPFAIHDGEVGFWV